jgi:riboflavin synthase alpha subunit
LLVLGISLTINNSGIVQNEQAAVSLISPTGQPVFQKETKATERAV